MPVKYPIRDIKEMNMTHTLVSKIRVCCAEKRAQIGDKKLRVVSI